MKEVKIKEVGSFTTKYLVYEYYCPKCNAEYEVHLEADNPYINRQVVCHKCNHIYRITQ